MLAEIDKAVAAYQFATNSLAATEGLAAAQSKRLETIRAQFNAGAAERVDVLSAQLEAAAADLLRLESQLKLQQSLAALEDAVQRPLPQAGHSL